jgi:CHASE1-domain containing sensor protein
MSRWLDRANGFVAYARATLAAAARGPLRHVLLAGVIGIALSSAAGWAVADYWEARQEQDETSSMFSVTIAVFFLQEKLTDLEQILSSIAGDLQSSAKEIDVDEFSRIVDRMRRVFDGTLDIAWAPRVFQQDRVTHERAAAASQGLAGYHTCTLGKDGSLVPVDAQDEYFPKLYSSLPTATSHIGMDIGSNLAEREAMMRARDSGELAVTCSYATGDRQCGNLPVRTRIWIGPAS